MATELATNLSSFPLLLFAVLAVLLASSVTDVTARQLTEAEIADLRNFVAQWDEVLPDQRSSELFWRDIIVETYAAQYKNFDRTSKMLMAILSKFEYTDLLILDNNQFLSGQNVDSAQTKI